MPRRRASKPAMKVLLILLGLAGSAWWALDLGRGGGEEPRVGRETAVEVGPGPGGAEEAPRQGDRQKH